MKQLLIWTAALLTALSFYSCKDDSDPEVTYKLDVNTTSLTFEADATEPQTVTVTSENVTWTAEVNDEAAEWLIITTSDSSISVAVTAWNQDEARTGTITVKPDTDKVAAKTVTVTQNPLEEEPPVATDKFAFLFFYGDCFNINAASYQLYVVMGDYDIEADGSVYVYNGSVIMLYMTAGEITKEDVRAEGAELPVGTYKCSSDYEQMSFIKTSYDEENDYYKGSKITNYANEEVSDIIMIMDGTVDVQKSGDVYTITMNFVYNDGTKKTVVFNDEMYSTENASHNSTYNEDISITDLSEGTITYCSSLYANDCYTWAVHLYSEGLFDHGAGNEIVLVLQSPMTSTTVLDNGTYAFDRSYSYGPFTAVPGSVYYEPVDSWVFEYENGNWVNFSPIVSGTVTVTATDVANGIYSITLDGEGDSYYGIKATYSGALKYMEYEEDTETGSAKNRSLKNKETNLRHMFKQAKSDSVFKSR